MRKKIWALRKGAGMWEACVLCLHPHSDLSNKQHSSTTPSAQRPIMYQDDRKNKQFPSSCLSLSWKKLSVTRGFTLMDEEKKLLQPTSRALMLNCSAAFGCKLSFEYHLREIQQQWQWRKCLFIVTCVCFAAGMRKQINSRWKQKIPSLHWNISHDMRKSGLSVRAAQFHYKRLWDPRDICLVNVCPMNNSPSREAADQLPTLNTSVDLGETTV